MVSPPPLTGIRVVEFRGLAPAPFAGMLLADAGASVLRIDRPTASRNADDVTATGVSSNLFQSQPTPIPPDLLSRHKASIVVDLRAPQGPDLVRRLVAEGKIDVLIDPFRPGVLERLGLGPDVLCEANKGLIYARLVGFRRPVASGASSSSVKTVEAEVAEGRSGPSSTTATSHYGAVAGHDINYLAVSGVLSLLGRAGTRPHAPWNLLADFAGGGLTLVMGVLLALYVRERNGGRGQVVDCCMVDGAAYLSSFIRFALHNVPDGSPFFPGPRGTNLLDGGCPFYDTYETKPDPESGRQGQPVKQYVAVGRWSQSSSPRLSAALGLLAVVSRSGSTTARPGRQCVTCSIGRLQAARALNGRPSLMALTPASRLCLSLAS